MEAPIPNGSRISLAPPPLRANNFPKLYGVLQPRLPQDFFHTLPLNIHLRHGRPVPVAKADDVVLTSL